MSLFLAACAATPTPAPQPVATATPALVKPQRGGLIGSTAGELMARFGQPRLQIREGDGTKLQFASTRCLLDAYLYPSGGAPRVTHIDTRTRDGRDTSQAECIAAIETR